MGADDRIASPILKLIAARHEELSILYGALADPEMGTRSEIQQGETAERPIDTNDLVACQAAGDAARKACLAGGKDTWQQCQAVGKIAEAACLTAIIDVKVVKDQ